VKIESRVRVVSWTLELAPDGSGEEGDRREDIQREDIVESV
jgi:hypothetical protein